MLRKSKDTHTLFTLSLFDARNVPHSRTKYQIINDKVLTIWYFMINFFCRQNTQNVHILSTLRKKKKNQQKQKQKQLA